MTRKFADISSLARHLLHAVVTLLGVAFVLGIAWAGMSQAPKDNKTALERVEVAQAKAAEQIAENAQAITALVAKFDERGDQETRRMKRIEDALDALLTERRND